MQEFQTFNRRSKVMTALGNNVHIFARPYRRQELTWCFETGAAQLKGVITRRG
jgi:hypothetical protein